ncbi:MAG: hypothetical protein ACOWWM_07750 [Desulfobacterales bacterium]
MKKLQEQLKAVTKELNKLSKKVERLQTQVAKASAAPQKSAAKRGAKSAAPKKAAATAAAGKKPTVLDAVYDVVRRSRNGATISKLKEKTGLSPRQLSNALYKLSTRGMIEAKSRGVYVKK